MGVVELLETVDAERERGGRHLAAATAHEHLVGAVDDERPVGQPGEHVVQPHGVQLTGLFGRSVEGAAPGDGERPQHEEQDQDGQCDGPPDHGALRVAGGRACPRRLSNGEEPMCPGRRRERVDEPPGGVRGVERAEGLPTLSGIHPRQGHVETAVGSHHAAEDLARVEDPPHPTLQGGGAASRRRGGGATVERRQDHDAGAEGVVEGLQRLDVGVPRRRPGGGGESQHAAFVGPEQLRGLELAAGRRGAERGVRRRGAPVETGGHGPVPGALQRRA